jgi:enoyl-CoA hydratase
VASRYGVFAKEDSALARAGAPRAAGGRRAGRGGRAVVVFFFIFFFQFFFRRDAIAYGWRTYYRGVTRGPGSLARGRLTGTPPAHWHAAGSLAREDPPTRDTLERGTVSDYTWLIYETTDDGTIAIVTLNRPRQRNAQHRGLLVELDAAMSRAQFDDAVRVVILRGAGTAFSSGHDLGSADAIAERQPGPGMSPTFGGNGGTRDGIEGNWLQEWHYFVQNTRRWRDLRKITIASVNGPVYAAGLMLMWACDLIVADTTATFADVVGTRLGMCGVEYFGHPWEFGRRRAKDLLLTGDCLTVAEARRLGMVARVFPPGELQEQTIGYARRIAALPSATSLLIKESVNQAQDHAGFSVSLNAAFSLHELNHAHYGMRSGGRSLVYTPELGATPWNEQPPVVPTSRTQARATSEPGGAR